MTLIKARDAAAKTCTQACAGGTNAKTQLTVSVGELRM